MIPTIGIDPGKHGGLVLLWENSISMVPYKKAIAFRSDYWSTLMSCEAPVVMEDVSGIPGDRAQVAFALGETNGFWLGVLSGCGIHPTFIKPELWETRFARQFGERWCPPDYNERKHFIWEKVNTVLPKPVTLELADAAALAWLKSKELV